MPAGGRIIIRDGSRHLWHRTMIVDVQNDGQNSICNNACRHSRDDSADCGWAKRRDVNTRYWINIRGKNLRVEEYYVE